MDWLLRIQELNERTSFEVCGALRDLERSMSHDLKSDCIEKLLQKLSNLATFNSRYDVLDAIIELSVGLRNPGLPWQLLLQQLTCATCDQEIEMTIACLGNSSRADFADFIRPFVQSKSEYVRNAARNALRELEHEQEHC